MQGNDKKLLITDTRLIMNSDLESYKEQESFFINEILWIAVSTKSTRQILFCVDEKATLYVSVSSKRREPAIALIKILYERLMRNTLKVYDVPKEGLGTYVVSGQEARTGEYIVPKNKYLRVELDPSENSSPSL